MRIALATVGTTGDVRPFAILARALADRGHSVTAVSWPIHRAALAQPGVRVEVAGPHADPARIDAVAAEAAARGPMDQVAILRDFHLADGEAHVRRAGAHRCRRPRHARRRASPGGKGRRRGWRRCHGRAPRARRHLIG